ncbi:TraR/DksA family transcriptional regulator [Lewinellaceae bacterium SD302]|nr:TraR/DksA family transcriptional regulator [Lewinellaceae bacterium SD302]
MDKEELKDKLREQIARTEEKIKGYESMSAPVSPDDAIGRVSRMDAINNKSVAEAALRQAKDKLSRMKHMLATIDDDPNFGSCKRCGKPIPPLRIILMPESPYCVRCA